MRHRAHMRSPQDERSRASVNKPQPLSDRPRRPFIFLVGKDHEEHLHSSRSFDDAPSFFLTGKTKLAHPSRGTDALSHTIEPAAHVLEEILLAKTDDMPLATLIRSGFCLRCIEITLTSTPASESRISRDMEKAIAPKVAGHPSRCNSCRTCRGRSRNVRSALGQWHGRSTRESPPFPC